MEGLRLVPMRYVAEVPTKQVGKATAVEMIADRDAGADRAVAEEDPAESGTPREFQPTTCLELEDGQVDLGAKSRPIGGGSGSRGLWPSSRYYCVTGS